LKRGERTESRHRLARARRAAPARRVEWDVEQGVRRGVAQDIDATGALLVRVDDEIVRVISGEVRWLT
jgi:biotin-(acetyl-CoA carboxylase) ligase